MALSTEKGATNYVTWAGTPDLSTSDKTIAFWILPDEDICTYSAYFMRSHNSGGAMGIYITGTGNAGEFKYAEEGSGTPKERRSAGSVLTVGAWQHYVFTSVEGTNYTNIKIYKNGVEISYNDGSSVNGTGTENATDGNWYLFGRPGNTARTVNGAMAGFGVWNRILTAGEISALASGYSPLSVATGALELAPSMINTSYFGDPITGDAGTTAGTVSSFAHPRIIYPSAQILQFPNHFNAQRQTILNNLISNKHEATGWNELVRSIPVSNVVRTSDTEVTITLPAIPTFDITELETITARVENSCLKVKV